MSDEAWEALKNYSDALLRRELKDRKWCRRHEVCPYCRRKVRLTACARPYLHFQPPGQWDRFCGVMGKIIRRLHGAQING